MSLLRLILLIAIIFIIYKLVRLLTNKRDFASNKPATTSMVRCAFCDVYIIKQDAYLKDEKYYCNSDHYEKSQRS